LFFGLLLDPSSNVVHELSSVRWKFPMVAYRVVGILDVTEHDILQGFAITTDHRVPASILGAGCPFFSLTLFRPFPGNGLHRVDD
jgi:hypothetical protein